MVAVSRRRHSSNGLVETTLILLTWISFVGIVSLPLLSLRSRREKILRALRGD
jgi:hypothetical protein